MQNQSFLVVGKWIKPFALMDFLLAARRAYSSFEYHFFLYGNNVTSIKTLKNKRCLSVKHFFECFVDIPPSKLILKQLQKT